MHDTIVFYGILNQVRQKSWPEEGVLVWPTSSKLNEIYDLPWIPVWCPGVLGITSGFTTILVRG